MTLPIRLVDPLLVGLADVNSALEEGAITNNDAPRHHIPDQKTSAANVHTVAGIHITAHRPGN
jgi:hypothetical protein